MSRISCSQHSVPLAMLLGSIALLLLLVPVPGKAATTIDCTSDPGALENELENVFSDFDYEIDGTCTAPNDGFIGIYNFSLRLRDFSGAAGVIDANMDINRSSIRMNGVDIASSVADIFVGDNSSLTFIDADAGTSLGGPSFDVFRHSVLNLENAFVGPAVNSTVCSAVCIGENSYARLSDVTVEGDQDDFTNIGAPVQVYKNSSMEILNDTDISNAGTTPAVGVHQNSFMRIVNRTGNTADQPFVDGGIWIGAGSRGEIRAGTVNDSNSRHAVRVTSASELLIPGPGFFASAPVTINGGNGTTQEAILADRDSQLDISDSDLTITAGTVTCRDSSRLLDTSFSSAAGVDCNNVAVATNGNFGLGTQNPVRRLHISESGGSGDSLPLRLEAPDGSKLRFVLASDSDIWTFDNAGNAFNISKAGTGINEFRVFDNGDLTIQGTLTEGSSREAKTDIDTIDPSAVLDKLTELSLTEWSYKKSRGARHLGPMAEDFHAVFGLGKDAAHIAPRNMASVAMASAQALKQQLDNKEQRIERLESDNSELRARVEELAEMVGQLATKVEAGDDQLAVSAE